MKLCNIDPYIIQILICISLVLSQFSCKESTHQLDLEMIESGTYSGTYSDSYLGMKSEHLLSFMVISEKHDFNVVYGKFGSSASVPEIDFNK